jgi:hypothetical protein
VKRILAVLFVLTIACGFAAAEGLGIDAGVNFKLEDVTDVADSAYVLTPTVEYSNSFGAIDVYVDLEYPIGFGYADEKIHQDPYLEEELGYNLFLGSASTLSFILNNNNTLRLSPELPDGFNKIVGTVEPSIKFNQGFNFGDLYAQAGFPIDYLGEAEDDDIGIGSYLLLGFGHSSGFGAEVTFNLALSPESEYTETGLLLSYERDAIYAEIEVVADKEFKGFTITPEFDYSFNAFTLWASVEFVKFEDVDMIISPTVGVKYSF